MLRDGVVEGGGVRGGRIGVGGALHCVWVRREDSMEVEHQSERRE